MRNSCLPVGHSRKSENDEHGLHSVLGRISRFILDILFPSHCVHCHIYLHDSPSPLCNACHASIEKNTSLRCPICSVRLANNRRTCGHGKQAAKQFPYLLGTASYYNDPIIRNCIHACKYEGEHIMTVVLSDLLIEYAQKLEPRPIIFATKPTVVPIPLHHKKERERGFNQSALIARSFAQAMHFPYDALLIKLIDNDPQAQTKTHDERFKRIRDAFAIPRPHDVRNKNIILIDDVSTSGATLSEAAQALKAAGAKQILALVIAKA